MALTMNIVPPRLRSSRRQIFQTEHYLSLAESKLRLRQANHSALLEAIGDLYLIRRTGNMIDNLDHALSSFRKAASLYSTTSFSYIRVHVKIGCTWYIRLRNLKSIASLSIISIHLKQAINALDFAIHSFQQNPPLIQDTINSKAYTKACFCRILLNEELFYDTLNSKDYQQDNQPNQQIDTITNLHSLQDESNQNFTSDSTSITNNDNTNNNLNNTNQSLKIERNKRLEEILMKGMELVEKTIALSDQFLTKEKEINSLNDDKNPDEQQAAKEEEEDEDEEDYEYQQNVIIQLDDEKFLSLIERSDEEEICLFVPSPESATLTSIEKATCLTFYAFAVQKIELKRAKQVTQSLEYLSQADKLLAKEDVHIEQSNNLKFEVDSLTQELTEVSKTYIFRNITCTIS